MAGLDELPGRVSAAATALVAVADTFPARAAQLVLDHTTAPVRTGRLADTGRVEADAAVFGGGTIDYAAAVNARDPFLDRGTEAAEADVAALFETDTAGALAGI